MEHELGVPSIKGPSAVWTLSTLPSANPIATPVAGRCSDSPQTWIRLVINFTELILHLFSKFGNNNCSERNIP